MNKETMKEMVKDLVLDALYTDGAHHKQWYLERILIELGYDITLIRMDHLEQGYEWGEGIAP